MENQNDRPPWFLRPALWLFDIFLTLVFGPSKQEPTPEQKRLVAVEAHVKSLRGVVDSEKLHSIEDKLSRFQKRLRENSWSTLALASGRYAVGSNAPDLASIGPEIPDTSGPSEEPVPLRESQIRSVVKEMTLWKAELVFFEASLLEAKKEKATGIILRPNAVDALMEALRWVEPEKKFKFLKFAKELVLGLRVEPTKSELEDWSSMMFEFGSQRPVRHQEWFLSRFRMIQLQMVHLLDEKSKNAVLNSEEEEERKFWLEISRTGSQSPPSDV